MSISLDGFNPRRVVCFAPTDGPVDPDDLGVLGRFVGARSDEVLWATGDVSTAEYWPSAGYFEVGHPTHRLRVVSRSKRRMAGVLARWAEETEALEAACQS